LAERSTYQWPALCAATNHCAPPLLPEKTGKSCPPKLAFALTVNRTVALPVPAGSAETIRNELTVILGAPSKAELTHER
jgi:hypothetical protein